jgi:hypothetical protein
MASLFYKNDFRKTQPSAKGLPVISRDLDSVRAYQFEVEFQGRGVDERTYRLAAKQVSPAGFTVDDIEAHRVNDKVFYPGKPSPEEITVTFDNLISNDVSKKLFEWFKGTYDPKSGFLGDSKLKINMMSILQLNHDLTLHSETQYYGVYPKSYKPAEWNYSTNEFHTIEVTFRYDFMDQTAKNRTGLT